MSGFRGTYTVMVTPFDAAGALDLATLRRFVDWQVGQGIHGLVPLGSTGEFLSLSDDEHVAVAETVIRQAAGRVPVLVGTGAEDTREAVRLSRRAEALGADGVMVIPPFYSPPPRMSCSTITARSPTPSASRSCSTTTRRLRTWT